MAELTAFEGELSALALMLDGATLAAVPESSDAIAPTPKEAFVLRDYTGLEWLAEAVLRMREKAAQHVAWAKSEANRFKRDEERLLEYYGPQVRDVIEAETRGKAKSVSVPSGRIGFRTAPAGFEVQDVDAFNAWCRENVPDACFSEVRAILSGHFTKCGALQMVGINGASTFEVTWKVDKAMVLAYFKAFNELPAGCCYSGGDERLVFTPAKAGSDETAMVEQEES